MRQEFLNIVNQLKTNPYYGISIIDDSTMNKILSTTLGSVLIEKYGSVENYFETLKNSGVTSFSVQEYKKNGSGWKNTGNVVRNLTFHDKTPVSSPTLQPNPAPAFPALNGAGNQVVGLGFYEAANLMAESKEGARLAEENKYLKEKNERLEKDIYELKEEKLKREYDATGKASQNDMLLGLVQNLPSILGAFKGGGGVSGLGAPAPAEPQNNLTQIKAEFFQYLSNPNVSDALIQALYDVATKIATEEGFAEKLENLLNPQQQ